MSGLSRDVGKVTGRPVSVQASIESQRAEWRVELYNRHYQFSIDQVAGHSKWLSATLFATNAAGLLTLINQSDKIPYILISGAFFVAGLVLALLSATANQEIYNRVSDPINEMISYWNEVKITGEPDEEKHDEIAADLQKWNRYMWIGPTLGWLSGISFVGGVIGVAAGLN